MKGTRPLIRNLYMRQRNCASVKGKSTVWRMEEESETDAACHPYYLCGEYLMKEEFAIVGDFKNYMALIAKTQDMVNRLVETGRKCGMKIKIEQITSFESIQQK